MNARWLQCMCAFSAVKIIWSINSPWKDNCGTTMKSFSFFLFWKVMTLLPSFIWWYCVHFCGYGACAIITRIAITIWCSVLHLLHFRILPTINIYCIQEMVVLWDLHFNLHGQLQSKCLRQCALLHSIICSLEGSRDEPLWLWDAGFGLIMNKDLEQKVRYAESSRERAV